MHPAARILVVGQAPGIRVHNSGIPFDDASGERWQEFAPGVVPLPHPSPRNNIWLQRNPWFTKTLLPELKLLGAQALALAPVAPAGSTHSTLSVHR